MAHRLYADPQRDEIGVPTVAASIVDSTPFERLFTPYHRLEDQMICEVIKLWDADASFYFDRQTGGQIDNGMTVRLADGSALILEAAK